MTSTPLIQRQPVWLGVSWMVGKKYGRILDGFIGGWFVLGPTLPETNSEFTPENRPKPKRKRESLPTIHFQV